MHEMIAWGERGTALGQAAHGGGVALEVFSCQLPDWGGGLRS